MPATRQIVFGDSVFDGRRGRHGGRQGGGRDGALRELADGLAAQVGEVVVRRVLLLDGREELGLLHLAEVPADRAVVHAQRPGDLALVGARVRAHVLEDLLRVVVLEDAEREGLPLRLDAALHGVEHLVALELLRGHEVGLLQLPEVPEDVRGGEAEVLRGRAEVDARVRLDVLEDLLARLVLQDVLGVHEPRAAHEEQRRHDGGDGEARAQHEARRQVEVQPQVVEGRAADVGHLRGGGASEEGQGEEDRERAAHG
ncbi:MAG TPA: hypothetical protein VNX21_02885, partial [Candidatus Thermoplasmatota archaeon]|nr:hypothetical protein [Candidatus Thermoplasmatota archaeon]